MWAKVVATWRRHFRPERGVSSWQILLILAYFGEISVRSGKALPKCHSSYYLHSISKSSLKARQSWPKRSYDHLPVAAAERLRCNPSQHPFLTSFHRAHSSSHEHFWTSQDSAMDDPGCQINHCKPPPSQRNLQTVLPAPCLRPLPQIPSPGTSKSPSPHHPLPPTPSPTAN